MGAEVERVEDGVLFSIRGVRGHFGGPRSDDDERWALHCRVPVPAQAPAFELDVRPRTLRERQLVHRGEAVDVELQDAPFEEAFLVEAAPSDLTRAVIDGPVRAALMSLAPCRLCREGDVLHLGMGVRRDDAWVAVAAGVCVAVAEWLARAGAMLEAEELDASRATQVRAYREAQGLSRSDAADLRARREIAEVREARRLRRQIEGYPLGVALIATLVGAMLLAWWSHC